MCNNHNFNEGGRKAGLLNNPISLLAHLLCDRLLFFGKLESSHMLPLLDRNVSHQKKRSNEFVSVTDLYRRVFHPSFCSNDTPMV